MGELEDTVESEEGVEDLAGEHGEEVPLNMKEEEEKLLNIGNDNTKEKGTVDFEESTEIDAEHTEDVIRPTDATDVSETVFNEDVSDIEVTFKRWKYQFEVNI